MLELLLQPHVLDKLSVLVSKNVVVTIIAAIQNILFNAFFIILFTMNGFRKSESHSAKFDYCRGRFEGQ